MESQIEELKSEDFVEDIKKENASILILGGLGFVGRNLLLYIIENNIFSKVVTADKLVPMIAYLPKKVLQYFENKIIKHIQVDLSKENSVIQLFENNGPFDYVVNLAAETRYGMNENEYKEKSKLISQFCSIYSEKNKVKKYIEISTALFYKKSKTPATETDKIDPPYKMLQYKFEGEQFVAQLKELNYVILRPAIIYGPNCLSGITQIMMACAVYKRLNEVQQVLWDEDKAYNTVHVNDVCRAIIFSIVRVEKGEIINLADNSNTTMGSLNKLLQEIFNIKIKCTGKLMSHIAWMNIDSLLENMNEKHLVTWLNLCNEYNIKRTPLSLTLYKEQLNKYDIRVNGQKLQQKYKFSFHIPIITKEYLWQHLRSLIEMEYYPNIFKQISEQKQL